MDHIESFNFEGGFSKVNNKSGLLTAEDKSSKLCRCIPFRVAIMILTGISVLSFIGLLVNIFVNESLGAAGILDLLPAAVLIPGTVLFGMFLKEETPKTAGNLTKACYLNALAFVTYFVIHIWKYIVAVNDKQDEFVT